MAKELRLEKNTAGMNAFASAATTNAAQRKVLPGGTESCAALVEISDDMD